MVGRCDTRTPLKQHYEQIIDVESDISATLPMLMDFKEAQWTPRIQGDRSLDARFQPCILCQTSLANASGYLSSGVGFEPVF